jgi:hypothetical protein
MFEYILKNIYFEKNIFLIFFNILILKIKKINLINEISKQLKSMHYEEEKKKEEISTTLICYSFSYSRVYIFQAASSKFQH